MLFIYAANEGQSFCIFLLKQMQPCWLKNVKQYYRQQTGESYFSDMKSIGRKTVLHALDSCMNITECMECWRSSRGAKMPNSGTVFWIRGSRCKTGILLFSLLLFTALKLLSFAFLFIFTKLINHLLPLQHIKRKVTIHKQQKSIVHCSLILSFSFFVCYICIAC